MNDSTDLSTVIVDEQRQSQFVDQLLLRQDEVIEQLDQLNAQIETLIRDMTSQRDPDLPPAEQTAAA